MQSDALHRVTREQEIVYRDDAIPLDCQSDKISWRLERDLAIVYEHRRTTVDDTRRKGPSLGCSVAAVVFTDLALPLHAQPCDERQRDILGQHCSHDVEFTRPKAVEI